MIYFTAACGHELELEGPFEGKHLGETEALPYHPRCLPMQNREHFHAECYEHKVVHVLDADFVRLSEIGFRREERDSES